MPKFEIVSLEEALEATKSSQWLDKNFGIELEEFQDKKQKMGVDISSGRCYPPVVGRATIRAYRWHPPPLDPNS